ncbi:MAG: hypothetical protein K5866_02060 [Treponema sp.]|nr:hypothetical protein [Treponema sp.]
MKKNTIFITGILLISTFLISCQKKEEISINEYGFYTNVSQAERIAEEEKKDIIVIVTMEGDDAYSAPFLEFTKGQDFKEQVTNNYVVLNLDFSEKSYRQTVVRQTDSKEDQKKAAAKASEMQESLQYANLLNVEATPAFYLLTSQEYFVAEFDTTYVPANTAQFTELLYAQQDKKNKVKELVANIATPIPSKILKAIDELYEYTEYNYRVFLADLVEIYIKMDANNSTGLLGKYLYADGENTALNYLAAHDYSATVKTYVDLANDKRLDPEYKQKAWFMAANVLISTGNTDLSQVVQYLNYAYDADPDGELIPAIQAIIDSIIKFRNTGF